MNGLTGLAPEGEDDRFKDAVAASQFYGLAPPGFGVHGAGDLEHDAVDCDLGTYDNGEVADVHRAEVRRRPEYVPANSLIVDSA